MLITVHRGGNQIGGSIIEVQSEEVRIILDIGSELEEAFPPTIPNINGLFNGEANVDAVLISHYHGDHTGLLNYILPNIPIYMAEKMHSIYKKSAEKSGYYKPNSKPMKA